MTQSLPAVIEWSSLPTKRDLERQLDRLPMSADAKLIMSRLLSTTADISGRVVEIGRSILAFILDLVKRFPGTALGAAVGLTVTVLLGSIPLLGLVLGPLVGHLLTAFMITSGALADMRNGAIERQIELFSAKLDAALVRG